MAAAEGETPNGAEAEAPEAPEVKGEGEGEGGELAIIEEPLTAPELLAKSLEQCSGGEFSDAVVSVQEALVLYRDENDREGEIRALCTLSQVQLKSGESGQALETARNLRTSCHGWKAFAGEAEALLEVADVHLALHEAKHASRAAGAALKLSAKYDLGEMKVRSLVKVVEAELQLLNDLAGLGAHNTKAQENIDAVAGKAYSFMQEALKFAEEVGQFELLGQVFYQNCRVLLIVGQEADARQAAGKARCLFKRIGDSTMEAETLLLLAQAEHRLDSSQDWASNAAHDALVMFQKADNQPAVDRTYQLFEDLGIALRVTGGVAPAGAIMNAGPADGAAAAAAAQSVAVVAKGLDPETVSQTVQEMAKAAIGLDEEIFQDSPLMDSGLDSLTAVSFRNGLQQQLGVKLPSSLMFDYPTMKDLSHRIVELSLEDE